MKECISLIFKKIISFFKKRKEPKWEMRETLGNKEAEVKKYLGMLLFNKSSIPESEPDEKILKENLEKMKLALSYAHDIRKFEIELFWKRATYFWVFISVIIVAYGSLISVFLNMPFHSVCPALYYRLLFLGSGIILLNILGLIVSYIWYQVIRNSKFWQQNWESHIDMLEFSITGNLHKMLYIQNDKSKLSVSKLNQVVGCCCVTVWSLLLVTSLTGMYHYVQQQHYQIICGVVIFIMICTLLYIHIGCVSSSASGNFVTWEDSAGE